MPDIFGKPTPVEKSLEKFRAAIDKKKARRRRHLFGRTSQRRTLTQAELDEAARLSAKQSARRLGEKEDYEEEEISFL